MMSTQVSGFLLSWDTPARNGSDLFFTEESYNRLCYPGHPETLEERLQRRFADIGDVSKVIKYDQNQAEINREICRDAKGKEVKLESSRSDEKKEEKTDLKEKTTQKERDYCKNDNNKDQSKLYVQERESTTKREKGLPFTSTPYIPPPRKSHLNHAQQIRYLDLQAKYGFKRSDDFTEEERIELREFKALSAVVVEEQAEFQLYLKKLAQCCNYLEYEFIHPEARKYIEECTSHRKREVETYPKYYSDLSSFPIEGTGQHSNLIYIKSLLQMGHIPKMILPNMSQGQNPQIPLDAALLCQQLQRVQSKPTDSSKWIHEQCSKDENAEFLAVTNQAHIVISSGALQCLVDNQPPQFLKEWELPVTVQEYDVPDGDKVLKHRVVYIDRPFAQKQQHPRQKNDKYFKHALMTLFSRPAQKGHNSGLHLGKTTGEGGKIDRSKGMDQEKAGQSVQESGIKNSEEKIITANEKKDNSVYVEKNSTAHEKKDNSLSVEKHKKGRKRAVESDVFGFGESSMEDLETFGTVSQFAISKEKNTAKRSDNNTGKVVDLFSDKCISSSKHKIENLDLIGKTEAATSLPGLSTVGSAFTKVSKSASFKCDSIVHFEAKKSSNEEIQLESNSNDIKSDTGLNSNKTCETTDSEKLCKQKMANESCIEKMTYKLCVEKETDESCKEKMSHESCEEKVTHESCIEKTAPESCVSNDIIQSSTDACSIAEVTSVSTDTTEIVNMEPRVWFKPQALDLISEDTQLNTSKSTQNDDDNGPNLRTRLPRQRCDSTSSCDSDKLVIDSCNDLPVEDDIERTETPASPSPASPDPEIMENVSCKIIPISLGNSPLRTSPTSPLESESFEWTPCKIIPLQRDSEDENIIDNSQTCDNLNPLQSSDPSDSPLAKSKTSQARGQIITSTEEDHKSEQIKTSVSSSFHNAKTVDIIGSNVNQSKSRRSSRESCRKVKDNSEMETGIIERNPTETCAVVTTRVTRSRKARGNISDISELDMKTNATTDTITNSAKNTEMHTVRTRGQPKKNVRDQSLMNADITANKYQRVTRSSSLEIEKSPPLGDKTCVPRKRGRPRKKTLSKDEEPPPAVKVLKEENLTAAKEEGSKNSEVCSKDKNAEHDRDIKLPEKRRGRHSELGGVDKPPGKRRGRPRKRKSGEETLDDDCKNENMSEGIHDDVQVNPTALVESLNPGGSFDTRESDDRVLDLNQDQSHTNHPISPEISVLSDPKMSAHTQMPAQVKNIFTSVLNSSLSSKSEDFEISIQSSGVLGKECMEKENILSTTLDAENNSEVNTKWMEKCGDINLNLTDDNRRVGPISDVQLVSQEKSDTPIESESTTQDGCAMPQTHVQTQIPKGSKMSEILSPPVVEETFYHTNMPKRSRISRISKQDHVTATNMDIEISTQDGRKDKNVISTKIAGQRTENTHKSTAKGAGDGKTKSTDLFSLDSLLQMQEKMLQPKSIDTHSLQQQTSEELPSVFKTPEKQNVTYNLWSLGGFQVLVRCGYHGYVKDINQQSTYVHVMPKLEYQTKYGWEQLTYSEIAKSWISTYIRPNCKLLRARVNAQKSELLSIEELAVSQTLSQIFSPSNCFLMLQNIFHKLHQLDVGKYLLQHVTSSNKCIIKKCTEDNKRGPYDLHFAHLGFVNTDSTSKKRVPWVPVDTNLRLPYHTINGRIPATFEPTDFKISQQRKPFKGGNKGKKKKKKKKK